MSEDERRRGERIPINDEFAGAGTWVSDLSLGGVFVHTDELVPVGSTIELRFTILIDDPIVIEAFGDVVRHSHKPRGMGVKFAAINPEMTARIEEILARRQPLDSGAPLRLPEPSRGSFALPIDDDEDDDDTTNRVVFARPAPVEGLGLRRVNQRELDDALTASFPRVESGPGEAKTGVFRPPPSVAKPESPALPARPPSKPQAQAQAHGQPREIKDDDRTRVYRAVTRDED